MELEKKIIVDFKVKTALLELWSYPTIRKALAGHAETPQQVKIREAALASGGMFKN